MLFVLSDLESILPGLSSLRRLQCLSAEGNPVTEESDWRYGDYNLVTFNEACIQLGHLIAIQLSTSVTISEC